LREKNELTLQFERIKKELKMVTELEIRDREALHDLSEKKEMLMQ
jgi:hypothetical protein